MFQGQQTDYFKEVLQTLVCHSADKLQPMDLPLTDAKISDLVCQRDATTIGFQWYCVCCTYVCNSNCKHYGKQLYTLAQIF